MSVKRFKFDGGSNCIDYDGKSILLDSYGDEIEELLNEQHEVIDICENRIAELRKENEQLKQQIKQLQHWNKCLVEKRHQELSYGYYTDSKAEKDLRDLLEQKSFNCSDG